MVTISNQQLDNDILTYFRRNKNRAIATTSIVQKFAHDDSAQARARIYERLRRLVRVGSLKRPQKGWYRYRRPLPAAAAPGAGTTRYEAMWRVLRARRTVSLDDLQEMAGVSREYASTFCTTMLRHEAVRCLAPGKYQLINDPVAMPRDEASAAKKRDARKAAALAAIDNAQAALAQAKTAINDMED